MPATKGGKEPGVAVRVAAVPGDGIGPEVISAACDLLARLDRRHALGLTVEELPAGAAHWRATDTALPEAVFARLRAADAILAGPMGLPDAAYPDGTGISPGAEIRLRLGLRVGMRAFRPLPGAALPLADPRAAATDLLLLRDGTGGLTHSLGRGEVTEEAATETLRLGRDDAAALFAAAFAAARDRAAGLGRPGRVVLAADADLLTAFAAARAWFAAEAARHPGIAAVAMRTETLAGALATRPWAFDVVVAAEAMQGEILAGLLAALVGGRAAVPAAEIGAGHALFGPAHGSAPRRAGTGRADPAGAILAAAWMLEWLAGRAGGPRCADAAAELRAALEAACMAQAGIVPGRPARSRDAAAAAWPAEAAGAAGGTGSGHARGARDDGHARGARDADHARGARDDGHAPGARDAPDHGPPHLPRSRALVEAVAARLGA